MSRRKPGRIRQKLAKMLAEHFKVPVDPGSIWDNNYPAATTLDVARWGVHIDSPPSQSPITIFSWDRMSECVQKGFTTKQDKGLTSNFEIYANEAAESRKERTK